MQVTKPQAAKMVGVKRSTFYKHIKDKSISITNDNKIDVSELQRVYGHENVVPLDQVPKENTASTKPTAEKALKEQIIKLETDLENEKKERQKDKEELREMLNTYKEQNKELNNHLAKALDNSSEIKKAITDQRSDKDKERSQIEQDRENQLSEIKNLVSEIKGVADTKKTKWFWQK